MNPERIMNMLNPAAVFTRVPRIGNPVRRACLGVAVPAVLLLPALVAPASAAPVFGEVFSIRQPDGSIVQARIWGDEFYGVTESLDGYTLIRDPETMYLCYARLSEDGSQLLSTGVRVGKGPPEVLGLSRHLRINHAAARLIIENARNRFDKEILAATGGTPIVVTATTGNVEGITILIEFPDEAGTIPRSEVQNYCNQIGYGNYGNNGSIRDYFYDVSWNQLVYTNYVSDYYEAAHDKAYYTDPTIDWGVRSRALATEALNDLNASGFDFSQYDADNNNVVDAVNFYYCGDHGNNWSEGLWPGSFSFNWSADGVTIVRIQMTNMGNALTIGTFCHENGHMLLGWPDLYDYDEDPPFTSRGVGKFCLMCNQASAINPVQPCAELKKRAGWCNLVLLTAPQTGLTASPADNTVYLFNNPDNVMEHYIIENRQQSGRDAQLPDHGLAVWHVDYAGSNDYEQMLPEMHYQVSLVQADGRWDMEHDINSGDTTDLYAAPYERECSPHSPATTFWWDGSQSGLHITNISQSGPTMTFDFSAVGNTWVDFNYVGFEIGSFNFPFNTLGEGVVFIPSEEDLLIKAGATADTMTITKPMVIDNWGGDVVIGQVTP